MLYLSIAIVAFALLLTISLAPHIAVMAIIIAAVAVAVMLVAALARAWWTWR